MSASSKFFANAAVETKSTVKHYMKKHPIIANSLLCLNLWVAGDVCAQYVEYQIDKWMENSSSSSSSSSERTSEAKKTKTDDTESSSTNQLSRRKSHHNDSDNDNDNDKTSMTTTSMIPSFDYDPIRTAQCAGYGATVTGPLIALWYPFMEKMCVQQNVTTRFGVWGAPIAKVIADELLMDPPCIVSFFGFMNICEGGTYDDFRDKVSSQFGPSWKASLIAWPPILLATFRFVPLYAQAPLINACCIVWDAFLSMRNAYTSKKKIQKNQEV